MYSWFVHGDGPAEAGATVVSESATKPWSQTVTYLRDNSGHLVELCTPMP